MNHAPSHPPAPRPSARHVPAAVARAQRADAPPPVDGWSVLLNILRLVAALDPLTVLLGFAGARRAWGVAWHLAWHPSLTGAWLGVETPGACLFVEAPHGFELAGVRVNDAATVAMLATPAPPRVAVAALDALRAEALRARLQGVADLDLRGPGLPGGFVVGAAELLAVVDAARALGADRGGAVWVYALPDGDGSDPGEGPDHLALDGGTWLGLVGARDEGDGPHAPARPVRLDRAESPLRALELPATERALPAGTWGQTAVTGEVR